MKTIEREAREFIAAIASNMTECNILLSDIANVLTDGEALSHLGATDEDQPMIEHAHSLVSDLINSGKKYWGGSSMTIAEQLKAFHTSTVMDEYTGTIRYLVDYDALLIDTESVGVVTQDWDNEQTIFDFIDGSVLIISGSNVAVYGAKQ